MLFIAEVGLVGRAFALWKAWNKMSFNRRGDRTAVYRLASSCEISLSQYFRALASSQLNLVICFWCKFWSVSMMLTEVIVSQLCSSDECLHCNFIERWCSLSAREQTVSCVGMNNKSKRCLSVKIEWKIRWNKSGSSAELQCLKVTTVFSI